MHAPKQPEFQVLYCIADDVDMPQLLAGSAIQSIACTQHPFRSARRRQEAMYTSGGGIEGQSYTFQNEIIPCIICSAHLGPRTEFFQCK